MLLRVSSEDAGIQFDDAAVVDRDFVGDVGIEASAELLALANAVEVGVPDLATARADVSGSVGDDGLLEAAATIAIFNGLIRVADGTGIQLDAGAFEYSSDDRARLGIDKFAGAANTDPGAIGGARLDGTIASLFGT
jgi:hypothetical protein